MKAIILAGGQGTRLNPLTLRTPKCLLPIAGMPNITYLINELNKAGITEVFVSINDKQLKINDFLKDKKAGVIIENQEKGKLGSIGGLAYAVNKLGSDDLIIIGADNYYEGLNINELISKVRKGSATIALYELPDKSMIEQFGIAELNGEQIEKFKEKPHINETNSRLASTLIYALSKEWVSNKLPEYLSKEENLDTIGSMWQYFATKDKIYGYVFKGIWADIGTARGYTELNSKIMKNKKIHESAIIKEGTVIKEPVIIEEGCIIGRNCIIGPGTHIMRDSTIGQGTIINESIIFENCHIGTNSTINKSIIDGGAVINDNVKINDYCIIGYKSVICSNSTLIKESRVWPFLKASGVINGEVVPLERTDDLDNSKYWVVN